MEEIWKLIENSKNYFISNLGNVKKCYQELTPKGYKRYYSVRDKILKPDTSVRGYCVVKIVYNDNTTKRERIHRLVAKYFIDNPNNYNQVNHKDGNKNNNSYLNLEWCDSSYNLKHAKDNNLWTSNYEIGEKNRNSKLTEDKVKQIPILLEQGYSSNEIAKLFNVSRAAINLIRKNKNWKYLNLFHN